MSRRDCRAPSQGQGSQPGGHLSSTKFPSSFALSQSKWASKSIKIKRGEILSSRVTGDEDGTATGRGGSPWCDEESLRGAGSCAKAHRGEAPGRFTRGHRGETDIDEGESVEDKNARGPVWFRVGVVRRPPSLVRPRNCKNWEGTPRALPRGGLIMVENRQATRPLRTATGRRACTTETA